MSTFIIIIILTIDAKESKLIVRSGSDVLTVGVHLVLVGRQPAVVLLVGDAVVVIVVVAGVALAVLVLVGLVGVGHVGAVVQVVLVAVLVDVLVVVALVSHQVVVNVRLGFNENMLCQSKPPKNTKLNWFDLVGWLVWWGGWFGLLSCLVCSSFGLVCSSFGLVCSRVVHFGAMVGSGTRLIVEEYLIWVVQHGTVVTLVSHSVHVRVLLVRVVNVRTVVALIQDL